MNDIDKTIPDEFQTANIDDLLYGDDVEELDEYQKAYDALLKKDRALIDGFSLHSRGTMHWPDPIRKRHLR